MTFALFALAWAVGIALGRQQIIPPSLWLLVFPLSLIGLLLLGRRRSVFHNIYWWQIALLTPSVLTLGALRMQAAAPTTDETSLAYYNDTGWVTLHGTISDAPDIRDTQTNIRLDVSQITLDNDQTQAVSGTVLVQAPRTNAYQYGDRIAASGRLSTPPEFDDFSYQDFLAQQGIFSLLQFADVQLVDAGQPSLQRALFVFRQRSLELIRTMLPDPQAALLVGILLGVESGLSPEIRQAFTATGASHVIAISGSNLAILAGLVQGISRRFLKEQVAAALTAVTVVAYTILVGADAAVVRAAVMVVLALVAARLGGPLDGLSALGLAAIVMSAAQPTIVFDIGFQLSFLATLGLVIFVEPMEQGLELLLISFMSRERARNVIGAVSEALIVSVASLIMTTPIIALYFGRFSVVSLPVNLLIVPAQTPLMVFGGIGVLLAHVLVPLGQVFTWASWVFLSITIWVVRLFATLPFAEVDLQVSALSTVVLYTLIGSGFILGAVTGRRPDDHWWSKVTGALGVKAAAAIGLIAISLLIVANLQLPDGRTHVTVIGSGDSPATLIQTPSGRTILIDGGTSGRQLSTALGDYLPFWQRRIDLLVVTEPTRSQVAGLIPILERYQVEVVLTNGATGDGDTVDAFWAALEQQNPRQLTAQQSMTIKVDDGVSIEVMAALPGEPPEEGSSGEPLALMLYHDQARVLVANNLSEAAQQRLAEQSWRLDSTVLLVPEGGNALYNQSLFLEQANPQVAVISVRVGNSRGLPDAETLTTLNDLSIATYRTDQVGNVTLTTDGQRLWVRSSD